MWAGRHHRTHRPRGSWCAGHTPVYLCPSSPASPTGRSVLVASQGFYTVPPSTLSPGKPDPFQSVHTQTCAQVLKISQMNIKYGRGQECPLNFSVSQLTGTLNSLNSVLLWKTPIAKTLGIRENKRFLLRNQSPLRGQCQQGSVLYILNSHSYSL